jgi:hypothetical protein
MSSSEGALPITLGLMNLLIFPWLFLQGQGESELISLGIAGASLSFLLTLIYVHLCHIQL